jgi:polar amino acid transport system substrate-binding protein
MRTSLRGLAIVPIAGLLLAACQGGTGSGSASASAGGEANACADASGEDLLATICEEGTIQISTDPNYAPQSFLKDDGTFEGFDIDVANEIGERLGVDVEFVTPSFDLVQAGGWNGQWDVSVGSITITESRKDVLDFTEPYYFTPAQLAASEESGITTIDGFAGETICVGAATTYLDWINGDLALGDGSTPAEVPEGVEAAALETDALCAESIAAGRDEFTGWLSSSTTVQQAINDEVPIVTVGDPVFFEPLAVATDKSGPEHAQLQAALDQIVADMHADGTLTELSEKWYEGLDLTKATE